MEGGVGEYGEYRRYELECETMYEINELEK